MKAAVFVAALCLSTLAAGCASAQPAQPRVIGGTCHTDALAWAVGQPANQANMRRLLLESGAGLWRIVTPNQAVPTDRRDDRLTVHADDNNTITSLECR